MCLKKQSEFGTASTGNGNRTEGVGPCSNALVVKPGQMHRARLGNEALEAKLLRLSIFHFQGGIIMENAEKLLCFIPIAIVTVGFLIVLLAAMRVSGQCSEEENKKKGL
jgi:hypothetical protein